MILFFIWKIETKERKEMSYKFVLLQKKKKKKSSWVFWIFSGNFHKYPRYSHKYPKYSCIFVDVGNICRNYGHFVDTLATIFSKSRKLSDRLVDLNKIL